MSIPHVTHLVISLAHGGLERLVVDWTNGRNERHPGSTSICCLDAAGDLAEHVRDGAVHVLGAQRQRMPWDVAAVRRLRALVAAAGGLAVIHSHNMAAQNYAALAVLGHRKSWRHVSTQHGANVHNHGLKNRVRARVLGMLTDRIVAVSESTARAMHAALGLPLRRIEVVPNGVAPHTRGDDAARATLRATLGIAPDAFVIGSVGRLDAVKGYDRLLRALPDVFRKQPATRLVLVGDGPARASLATQATDSGIAHHVLFAGYQPDARMWLDIMDLFVLSSRSEGLSVALLEAMSAGVPVMVTDVGENRAVIGDGATGVILPDDESAWPAHIGDVVRSRARGLSRKVAAAVRRVDDVYALEHTLEAYEAIYADLSRSDSSRGASKYDRLHHPRA